VCVCVPLESIVCFVIEAASDELSRLRLVSLSVAVVVVLWLCGITVHDHELVFRSCLCC